MTPSSPAAVNAAWVGLAVLAFNLARAIAVAANMATARWATVRKRLINIPGRVASSARRHVLHLPRDWPWRHAWDTLWATATT